MPPRWGCPSAAVFAFQVPCLNVEFAGELQQSARDIGIRCRIRETPTAFRLVPQEPRLPAYVVAILGHAGVNTHPIRTFLDRSARQVRGGDFGMRHAS